MFFLYLLDSTFFTELHFFEFLVEIEINATSAAAIYEVKSLLEGFSISYFFKVRKVDITTGKN